jgi:transcriptional regulator with XRE-family HTH domain
MEVDGDKLRRARARAALTLRELAEASGVDFSTIWQLETGRRGARPSTVRKLAAALGVTPADLIPDEDGAGPGKALAA